MADPRCPSCDVEGIEHISSKASQETSKRGQPWFYVAYCKSCGHIYGVFPKHTMGVGSAGPQVILPPKS